MCGTGTRTKYTLKFLLQFFAILNFIYGSKYSWKKQQNLQLFETVIITFWWSQHVTLPFQNKPYFLGGFNNKCGGSAYCASHHLYRLFDLDDCSKKFPTWWFFGGWWKSTNWNGCVWSMTTRERLAVWIERSSAWFNERKMSEVRFTWNELTCPLKRDHLKKGKYIFQPPIFQVISDILGFQESKQFNNSYGAKIFMHLGKSLLIPEPGF